MPHPQVKKHRHKRRRFDRFISNESRHGLDWANFFMADVQTGFGSFVAFYLADIGWTRENVGVALAAGGMAGVVAQIPGGALADALRAKRGLAATGFLTIGLSALILALKPTFPMVFVAEVLQGLTAGTVGPALAAISLGLVGRKAIASRIGRNYRYQAAGTVIMAGAMGLLGVYFHKSSVFIVTAVLCISGLIALARIRPNEISYVKARNATDGGDVKVSRVRALFKNKQFWAFTAMIAVFQFANASILPLVSENLGQTKGPHVTFIMSSLILGPQIIVTFLAPWTGYLSELLGRKPLMMVGFGAAMVRAVFFAFIGPSWALSVVQLLDGLSGSIITVLTVLIVTDLTKGTGRFNLANGLVSAAIGLSAAAGTSSMGFFVQHWGDRAGYLVMAAAAGVATVMAWLTLPETKPHLRLIKNKTIFRQ